MQHPLRRAAAWAAALGSLLTCSAATAQPREPGFEQLSQQSLRALLEQVRDKHGLPALGVAVIEGDQITVATAGVRKAGDLTPVTDEDKFHLGSCTKAMTATLAATFVEKGELKWETTIAEVFPELAGEIRPQYRSVTLRQLLEHRAGLPAETLPKGSQYDDWRRRTDSLPSQRLAYTGMILRDEPEAPPGTKMIYANAGYIIAGAMLERLTGKNWEDLLRERLLQPLEMNSAGFGNPAGQQPLGAAEADKPPSQPWPHLWGGKAWQPVAPSPGADNPLMLGPAGTLHCSLGDWAQFARLHLQGEQGRSPLLKPEAFRALHTTATGGEYGLGWGLPSRPWGGGTVLQHAGSNTMNFCVAWLAHQRGFGVLVATNSHDEKEAPQACDEVAAAVITQLAARFGERH